MNLLDMRTVLLGYAMSNLICVAVIAMLWKQNRARFDGLGLWLVDFVLQFVSLSMLALRGFVPDFLSMTGSNSMVIGGTILMYLGLELFIGKKGRRFPLLILLAAFIVAHAFFVYGYPSMAARNILFSSALMLICIRCVRLLLHRADPGMRAATRGVGGVFIAFCAVSAVRIVVDLLVPSENDLFRSNAYDTFILAVYQMVFILLTFFLSLMVNRRLFMELEIDKAGRTQAEADLRLSEEKFSKAFRSGPDAVLISRVKDGGLIEVNEGFCRLTGYSREEALSGSSLTMNLWVDPRDRETLVARLRENSRVRDLELDFRTKSGKTLNGLYSGEIIDIGGEACILSIVHDITDRKRTEAVLRLRLILWEYAAAHSVRELMQKALDEIEALTGSLIGFYHFVEEETASLTLQAWSTRTREAFCKAEGEGMHYPISEAGVWVDCIREKAPVIHNDYASLPNKRGMPPGHAEVVRELVVPTLRDGRIMSVLGVGNKPSDYDERDVELVAYIADLIWTIVVQKRAEEQVLRLNGELGRLAMTDELTGLANRRSYFARGKEEMKRASRYGSPLSLIMLDVDNFKSVNDTYGHDAGDEALRRVATAIRGSIREVDAAARLGGEEFGILLPSTKAQDARTLAERLRLAIEEESPSPKTGGAGVTASVGVAVFSEGMRDFDALMRKADTAMYLAKGRGRNRVVLLDTESE